MMKKLLLVAFVLFGTAIMVAQTTITGTVNDASLGGPLPGANIKVLRKAVGTSTDFDGKFTMTVTDNPPFTIEISSLGYQSKTVEITKNNQVVEVSLTENATSLDEVVVSASRTPERVMESPVTIERFDSRAIKNTASASYYDGLENLKGVDINSGGFTFKTVNTRGFATFGNERFVQLVDGMDNASPALNFAIGNLLGISEVDVKSVEILPGAASALYGANAFNGIMLMRSKNPFNHQGISVGLKTGLTSQEAAGDNKFYDATIRMAHAFDDYFAVKASFSYLKGEEWHATDYRNTTGIGGSYIPGTRQSDPNYDGANVYGDEVSVNLGPAIGNVSRTGYTDQELMTNEAKSVKFNGAIHYRPLGNDRVEIIWNSKYGTGNTIYQGQNRYNLANFFMEQHKLEVRGKNFFVRGYYAGEDAGDSYDTRFAAININSKWKSNTDWFGQYAAAYLGAIPGVPASNHAAARAVADTGRAVPGTPAFQALFDEVTADPDLLTGSKFRDNTSYYHADGNLNLRDYIDWAEVQVGGSYRQYRLNSFGTIYTDADGPIKYGEYGVYTQLQKKMLDDRLKFTGSIRYDKSENFDGNFTPRISLAYAAGENKNHNFRASFQTGFRNPTTQDQYIGLATGAGFILGTAPDNIGRFSAPAVTTTGSFTLTGADVFSRGYSASSIATGTPTLATTALVKPEEVKSFEVGYRGVLPLGDNKLSVDFSTYYNMYSNFISNKDVLVLVDPTTPVTVANLTNRDLVRTFSVKTNSTVDVDSYGLGIGLSTKVFNGYNVGLNYTWSKFSFDQAQDPDFEAGFNTPEHKLKAQFGHPNVFENFGFNVSARWQTEFYWQSTFLEGNVEERTVLDAQINYSVPSIKSVFKVGGSNLTGKEYLSAPGVGAIGSQYYISWTINN
ncbi:MULTISPECIES: TonB-dependent receptor [unclassified Tenacibaculum]|uniref:TonB-dependent receptor n=1 Tax=unclassified Tenacibaculum TaxID=2635139 RepID=UPI001F36805C|nr:MULTISPECIES: TonB-dependent receptor [unclassified Tenacibaculum]MCF2876063.1 carboxypeptidase-like regulatory domain-containing protein [Tenacibaculum sp. Cn5-1]MCF2936138.1 carboxypeptidase-like regulatory domain-containing protein [Tenacibaculum sp. Cn5-34]MCG7512699.1 carboxypeptidase-like regulatory domain-containing protein [Tenacibaculum sp. Cn5-46]